MKCCCLLAVYYNKGEIQETKLSVVVFPICKLEASSYDVLCMFFLFVFLFFFFYCILL